MDVNLKSLQAELELLESEYDYVKKEYVRRKQFYKNQIKKLINKNDNAV